MSKNVDEINEDNTNMGTNTEEDLVEKAAERLAAIPGLQENSSVEEDDDDGEDGDNTEKETSTSQSEEDETEGDGGIEEDDGTKEEEETSTSQSKEDETEEKINLPDAYYRAALHQEWKPEEIKEFYKSNPELAKRTFAKIYESVNKVSDDFAALGRLKLKQTQETQNTEVEKNQSTDIDIGKLREDYDNPGALVDIVEQLQKQNKILTEKPQQAYVTPARTDQVLDQQIDTFFTADDLKLFDDFYGPGKDENGKIVLPDGLTPGQKANRHAVLEFADSLIAGYALKGQEMPVSEALELAHLKVTDTMREQKIREEIMGNVVKRSKGITLKGSGKKQVPIEEKTGKLSDGDVESRAGKRLARIFN